MTLVPLTARPAAEPLTAPMPRHTPSLRSPHRLSDVVHSVTATFGSAGWTLRFGPSGHQSVVGRLADADGVARRLVGAALGLPPAAVRVRIAPDGETLGAVRRGRLSRSSRRGRADDM